MKATAESLTAASVGDKSCLAVFAELIKARLTFLVVVTTLVGFYVGFQGEMDYALMLHTVLGTALVAGGAAALNQLMERELDARMRRSEEHTSELQSLAYLVCRLLLEKKKGNQRVSQCASYHD